MNDSHDMDKELIKEIQHYAGKLPPERQGGNAFLKLSGPCWFTRKELSGREAKKKKKKRG